MANHQKNYAQLERFLTLLLYVTLAVFVCYLLFAGLGVIPVKIITAVIAILGGGFCLFVLYNTKELFRSRSLWLTCAFSSIVLLTIVSLICNFPSPK